MKPEHRNDSTHPQVKVATFNLMNLAMPEKNYYPHQSYSLAEYHQKIIWTAGQLGRMDADLVGFQEVFDLAALRQAVDDTKLYRKAWLEVADECGHLPRVALLSRLPVRDFQVISDFPAEARISTGASPLPYTRFHRPVILATVEFPGGQAVKVIVCHLKSKRPLLLEGEHAHDPWAEAAGSVRSLTLRACEAAALRWLILREIRHSETPLILLGDLNDGPHAVTSDILQGAHPQKNYPGEVKKKLWDILLYSCQDLQIRRSYKDVYYTHLHNSHYESLDSILVSQEFVNENPRHIGWVEYMRLYNDHLLDPSLGEEGIPVWQSDHGQVLVSIRMC